MLIEDKNLTRTLAKISTNYSKYNLNESNSPEKWEDGTRTNSEKGTYEWWYFDAHLDDGSIFVITFFTRDYAKLKQEARPLIKLDFVFPDGTKIEKNVEYAAELFSASKDSCDVKVGKNYFRGNLSEYDIHFEDEELSVTAKVKRTSESWRPKTGITEFGDKGDYMGWVVPVPKGETTIEYTYKGKSYKTQGSCYHDHNWGNKIMIELFNHWYWARAEVGPYTIIAAETIPEKEFDGIPVSFHISKNGKVVADDEDLVKVYRTYRKKEPKFNKVISDDLIFMYNNPDTGYRYEFALFRKENIAAQDLLEGTTGGKNIKYRIAKLITGFDGAYYRFSGLAEIKVYKNDEFVEKYSSTKAVWELMFFGKA